MRAAKVAVMGAGNVGCALAAHLTLLGNEVRLCNRSADRLDPIRMAGGITATGSVEGFAPIAMLTTNLSEAVAGAEVIAITVPAPALPHYAAELVEASTEEQLLWLNPGHSGGALYLGAEFRRRGADGKRLICQLSTASHGARMVDSTNVGVFAVTRAALAAFPGGDLDECAARLDAILPGQFGTANTVLELDLQNVNAVMHPAQMVCNASWIEATAGDFFIYREGTGRAVAGLVERVDAERMALAARLGVPTLSLVDAAARAGYTTAAAASTGSVYDALQGGDPIARVKAPPTLDHRYLHEDVGWGLVQWIHLGVLADVPTRTMDAITTLASILNNRDYRNDGLTLERMGLAERTAEEIMDYAINGERRPG